MSDEFEKLDELTSDVFEEASSKDYEKLAFGGEMPEPKKSKTPIIVLAVICIAVIIAAVIALVLKDTKKPNKSTEDVAGEVVIKLGDYKNFTYKPFEEKIITDQDVTDYANSMLELYKMYGMNAGYNKLEDRAGTEVKDGDTVNIDFVGYMDGEEFKGGKGNTDLGIGSGQFIPGFEDALIGKEIGTEVEIEVTFPDPYENNPDFSGKPAIFKVTINYAEDPIELTADNLYLGMGFDSNEELMDNLKGYLESMNATLENYLEERKNDYVDYIIEGTEFNEAKLKEEALEFADSVYAANEKQVNDSGYTMDQYITEALGYSSVEEYKSGLLEFATYELKERYILTLIAKEEGIELTDVKYSELLGEAYESVKDRYDTPDQYAEEYDKYYGEGEFRDFIFTVYAVDTLFEKYAVASEDAATPADAK